jgi:hypothetical protein
VAFCFPFLLRDLASAKKVRDQFKESQANVT